LIAQYSDSVIFAHREIKKDGITETDESFTLVRFHRRTGVWDLKIVTEKEGNYLKEI
jgi:hypothetical protein